MHIDMDEGQRNWQFIIIKLIFRNRPSMVSTSLRKVTSSVKPFQIRICVRVSGGGGGGEVPRGCVYRDRDRERLIDWLCEIGSCNYGDWRVQGLQWKAGDPERWWCSSSLKATRLESMSQTEPESRRKDQCSSSKLSKRGNPPLSWGRSSFLFFSSLQLIG